MKQLLALLPLAALAACAPAPRALAPVSDVHYSALGQNPFWMLTIGDDRIVLSTSPQPGARPDQVTNYSYPRTLPRQVDGARIWESGDGTHRITVEARPGPCEGPGGRRFEDDVTVRLGGWTFTGCGGQMVPGRRA